MIGVRISSPRGRPAPARLVAVLRQLERPCCQLRGCMMLCSEHFTEHCLVYRWRLLLRETVEALLAEAEAETTADEDRLLLQRPSRPASNSSAARAAARGNRGGDRRRRAALLCRMGEKQLLRSVLEEVNDALG